MSAIILWMDTLEARIFHVEPESINFEKVRFEGPHHPKESSGKNHPQSQTDQQKFFAQLSASLKKTKAEFILLMGPSLGATHFENYLETHDHLIAKKVIGVEKVDQMPDSEILSIGRKYLQRYYLVQAI